MSMETAELLFLCHDVLVSTIEDEVQTQLQHITDWYRYVRPTFTAADQTMEHILNFDMATVINMSTKKAHDQLVHENRYVDAEIVQGHVALLTAALDCIDWVDKRGKSYGNIAIRLESMDHDDDNRDGISPSTCPAFVEVIHRQDSLSFDNTSFVVREANELLITPRFCRGGRPLPSDNFRSMKFELVSEIPWLSWNKDLSVFRGIVPFTRTFKSTGTDLLDMYPENPMANLSIVIKATLTEGCNASKVELRRVVRTRLNIDVYPWWHTVQESPGNYASLKDIRLLPDVPLPFRTAPARKSWNKDGRHGIKPLEALFQAPSSRKPAFEEQRRDSNKPNGIEEKSPSAPPRKLSFEGGLRPVTSIKTIRDTPNEDIGNRPRWSAVSQDWSEPNVCPARTPSLGLASAISLPIRSKASAASFSRTRADSYELLEDMKEISINDNADTISFPDHVSFGVAANDPLERSIDEFLIVRETLSLQSILHPVFGGRFAPLMDLDSGSTLTRQSSSSESHVLSRESSGLIIELDEGVEVKSHAGQNSRDDDPANSAIQQRSDRSSPPMLSHTRPDLQPEIIDNLMDEIQRDSKRFLLSCMAGTAISGEFFCPLIDEHSLPIGTQERLKDKIEGDQEAQSSDTQEQAARTSSSESYVLLSGESIHNASEDKQHGRSKGSHPILPMSSPAKSHTTEGASDKTFSGYESGYEHDMFVPQPRISKRNSRRNKGNGKGSRRQKKIHRRMLSPAELSPSKRRC